jgi:hypothetical protein
VVRRPRPIDCAIDQSGSHWISFDIAGYRQKVIIVLDTKTLVAPLPKVTTAAVMTVIASDVGSHEPLHAAAQIFALSHFDQ